MSFVQQDLTIYIIHGYNNYYVHNIFLSVNMKRQKFDVNFIGIHPDPFLRSNLDPGFFSRIGAG